MKTASWYIPWAYEVFHGWPGMASVRVFNGAGQPVQETEQMPADKANTWIERHRQNRARMMGALEAS